MAIPTTSSNIFDDMLLRPYNMAPADQLNFDFGASSSLGLETFLDNIGQSYFMTDPSDHPSSDSFDPQLSQHANPPSIPFQDPGIP